MSDECDLQRFQFSIRRLFTASLCDRATGATRIGAGSGTVLRNTSHGVPGAVQVPMIQARIVTDETETVEGISLSSSASRKEKIKKTFSTTAIAEWAVPERSNLTGGAALDPSKDDLGILA